MSSSAAQQALFFKEIHRKKSVWTVRDTQGFPAPLTGETQRVMSFWSTKSSAQKIIDTVDAYRGFTPFEISLNEWADDWLTGLEHDDMLVGLNWYGQRATGYDLTPTEVKNRLKTAS